MIRRTGFSLIEMVCIMVATGMLLTLSAKLLSKTFEAHRDSLLHLQRMRSIELFVDRWRDDVQSSQSVTPGADLRITAADNTEIVYSIVNQSVVRTRRQNGQDIGQDQWQLPSQCTVTWHIDEQGRKPLLIGKLEFSGDVLTFDPVNLISRVGIGGSR
jgi:hypothetical protein